MASTLTYLGTTLALPDDLLWTDEFGWQAVEQRSRYTITGALIVEPALKQSGRSIVLAGGQNWGWMPRATLLQLQAWSVIAGAEMTLVLRGVTRTVLFDHAARPIEVQPVIDYADPDSTDDYVVTLRFIEKV